MKKSDPPIVVAEVFDASIEKVWNAITALDEMREWYFNNIDAFRPEVGSKSEFAVHPGERTFTHLWEVTGVEWQKRIEYNWKYREYPGDSVVNFELEQKGEKVKLTITVVVTEDFPGDIPEFKRESCIGGWNYFINGRLKEYLGSRTFQSPA